MILNVRKLRLFVIAIPLLLVGCTPTLMHSNPESVTVKSDGYTGGLSSAAKLADIECQKYGKYAVVIPENTSYIYSFECRKPTE